jgi:lysophospholipase L1-like esterase
MRFFFEHVRSRPPLLGFLLMNPAAVYLASGDSLYPGAVLLVSAVAWTSLPARGPRLLQSLMTWLGLAMIVIASPPISGWAAAIFVVAFLVWLNTTNRVGVGSRWLWVRVTATCALLTWLLAVPVSELLHRRMPLIGGQASDRLVVIGDSISSGIDAHTPAWPTLFQLRTGIAVRNLSRPGANVVEARGMAPQVKPQDTLILIEIGGNDLLSGTSAAEFGQGLDSLLSSLAAPGRTLVMFELPLLPHKTGYGKVQRRLSSKYGVLLIPKHFFTRVLSGADATSDGLHLSESGAGRMSALVEWTLSPVLRPTQPATE